MKKLRVGAALSAAALTITVLGATPPAHAKSDPQPGVDHYAQSKAVAKADNKAKLDKILKLLPKDWEQRRDAARQRFHIDHSPAEDILAGKVDKAAAASTANAIDPTQYQCSATPLDGYVDQILADVDPSNLFILSLIGALDLPTYEAILFGAPKDPDFALPAAYKDTLTSTFGYAQRFWDVRLDDVKLMAMHGEMVMDINRSARTLEYLYGVGPADATEIATEIRDIVASDPGLENGSNPIFTLNAFAFSGEGDPDPVIRKLKDKMVFGDGILAALKAIGLNGVGPKAVLGHEMSHHVQYEDNLFETDLTGAEATRRTELMADGFGTYFLAHKKGLGLNPNQILKAGQSFYDVGDCAFDSSGHHGTPNQRRAASAWGAAEVAYANNPNKVIASLKLDKQFEKALPILTAPDAPASVSGYKSLVAAP